jgi:hypothetical protein
MKWASLHSYCIHPRDDLLAEEHPRLTPLVWSLLGFLPFVTRAWNLEASPIFGLTGPVTRVVWMWGSSTRWHWQSSYVVGLVSITCPLQDCLLHT